MKMEMDELTARIDSLRGTQLRRQSPSSVMEMLRPLLAQKTVFFNRFRNFLYFRARKIEAGEENYPLQKIIYPPPEKTPMGRANLPGKPVLYASDNLSTALDEVAAERGDRIQIAWIQQNDGIGTQYHIVGNIEKLKFGKDIKNQAHLPRDIEAIQAMKQWEPERLARETVIDGFLADLFRTENKRACDYLTTAVYSQTFYDSGTCVLYPAVERRHGINAAIPRSIFDSNFHVERTAVIEIVGYYGSGIYQYAPKKGASHHDANGEFVWEDLSDAPPQWA